MPTTAARYMISRTFRLDEPCRCQGRDHEGGPIPPQSPITCVVDVKMAMDAPNDPEGRRYLCDTCLSKLAARVVERERSDEFPRDRTIEGPEVEPW